MNHDHPHARIGYRDGAVSRAKNLASKVFVALGAGLMLASAFVLSLAFLAIGFAVVLTFGGYLWWKTRHLRRQMRARMEAQSPPTGNVIEGEFVEGEVTSRERIRR